MHSNTIKQKYREIVKTKKKKKKKQTTFQMAESRAYYNWQKVELIVHGRKV